MAPRGVVQISEPASGFQIRENKVCGSVTTETPLVLNFSYIKKCWCMLYILDTEQIKFSHIAALCLKLSIVESVQKRIFCSQVLLRNPIYFVQKFKHCIFETSKQPMAGTQGGNEEQWTNQRFRAIKLAAMTSKVVVTDFYALSFLQFWVQSSRWRKSTMLFPQQ